MPGMFLRPGPTKRPAASGQVARQCLGSGFSCGGHGGRTIRTLGKTFFNASEIVRFESQPLLLCWYVTTTSIFIFYYQCHTQAVAAMGSQPRNRSHPSNLETSGNTRNPRVSAAFCMTVVVVEHCAWLKTSNGKAGRSHRRPCACGMFHLAPAKKGHLGQSCGQSLGACWKAHDFEMEVSSSMIFIQFLSISCLEISVRVVSPIILFRSSNPSVSRRFPSPSNSQRASPQSLESSTPALYHSESLHSHRSWADKTQHSKVSQSISWTVTCCKPQLLNGFGGIISWHNSDIWTAPEVQTNWKSQLPTFFLKQSDLGLR